jgi:hypothetical protein
MRIGVPGKKGRLIDNILHDNDTGQFRMAPVELRIYDAINNKGVLCRVIVPTCNIPNWVFLFAHYNGEKPQVGLSRIFFPVANRPISRFISLVRRTIVGSGVPPFT